jgi:hypothetical protein
MALLDRPDLSRVLDRWEAWWMCENESPMMTSWISPTEPHVETPLETAAQWLDFDQRVDAFESRLAVTPAFGDNIPFFFPNLGPDVAACAWGAEIEFGKETSWVHPLGDCLADLATAKFSRDWPQWKRIEDLTRLSLARSEGRWITGFTDLHLNADLLVSLIGPENLCLELADDRDSFAQALARWEKPCLELLSSQHDLVLASQDVSLSWMHAPAKGRMHIPSCDFSCLVSGADYCELILPIIQNECRACDRSIYHLDGPQALRHLDAILACPEIHGVQWVYGAGQGPARRWIEVYQRIQAAGKCMMVCCDDAEDALVIADALRPGGVWFDLPGMDFAAAEALHREVTARS